MNTMIANGVHPPTLNANAVLVNKFPGAKQTDEPRLTFNYYRVKELKLGSHLELMSRVHD